MATYKMSSCNCDQQRVKILFVRHGFSCANAQQYHHGTAGRLKKLGMRDPPLTSQSVRNIIGKARPALRDMGMTQPDAVIASTLLRAQQTAHYLFPRRTVYVAPFISELGRGLDNASNPPKKQKQVFFHQQQAFQQSAYKRKWFDIYRNIPENNKPVSYRFVRGSKTKPYIVPWDKANVPNYNKFIFWLELALPTLLHVNNIPTDKKDITIAIVGHSHFMMKNIKNDRPKDKPHNVGMVEINFCWRKTNEIFQGMKVKKLYPVGGSDCNCPSIPTLRAGESYSVVGEPSPNCNGVVYHGFPVPCSTSPNKSACIQQFENNGMKENCPF